MMKGPRSEGLSFVSTQLTMEGIGIEILSKILLQDILHGRHFISDFFFRKHNSARQWEPYNSAAVVGKFHLKAGIEAAGIKKSGQSPFKVVELFRQSNSNVVVDVTIGAKKFWPILPDLVLISQAMSSYDLHVSIYRAS
jgi:hypothetical protein